MADIRIIPALGAVNVTGSADFRGTGASSVLFVSGSGNVGVGTTNPTSKLHVAGAIKATAVTGHVFGTSTDTSRALSILNSGLADASTYAITLGYGASNNNQAEIGFYLAGTGSASNRLSLGLYNSNNTVNILGSGNVGIGTTSPGTLLDLRKDTNAGTTIRIRNTNAGTADYAGLLLGNDTSSNGGGIIIFGSQTTYASPYNPNGTYVYSNRSGGISITSETAAPVYIATNNQIRLYAASGGNVGIGNSTPLRKLHVVGDLAVNASGSQYYGVYINGVGEGADPNILIGDWHNASANLTWDSSARTFIIDTQYSTGAGTFKITGNDQASTFFQIDNQGDVTIYNDLTVDGIITAKEFHTTFVSASIIYQSGSTQFGDSSDDIHSFTGNVGIGTTAPSAPLEIYGQGALNYRHLYINSNEAIGGGITLQASASNAYSLIATGPSATQGASKLLVYRDGVDGGGATMAFDSNGRVGIGTTNPTQKLTVSGSINLLGPSAVYLDGTSTWAAPMLGRDGAAIFLSDYSGVRLGGYNGSSYGPRMYVLGTGEVGIGTASPAALLDVNGASILSRSGTSISPDTVASSVIAGGITNSAWGVTSGIGGRAAGTGDTWAIGHNGVSLYFGIGDGAADNSLATFLRADADRSVALEAYGSGTFTGTAAYNLSVDASGNIIETANPSLTGTGTANYITKWSGTNTLTNSVMYDDGTNIGIGIITPQALLDVNGNIYNRSGAIYTNTIAGYTTNIVSINANTNFYVPSGNVSIGTTSPDAIFHVAKSNAGDVGGQIVIDNFAGSTLGNTAEISFLTNSGASASGSGTRNARILAVNENASNGAANMQFHTWNGSASAERMRITSGGNVGIGTASPSTKLHLYDANDDVTLKIHPGDGGADSIIEFHGQGGNIITEGFQIWYDNNVGDVHLGTTFNDNAAAIRFHTKTGASKSTSNERMTITGDGNVGIGTTSPDYKLKVAGTFYALGTTIGSTLYVSDVITGNNGININAAKGLNLYNAANNSAFTLYNSGSSGESKLVMTGGSVGINTNSPSARLDVYQSGSSVFNVAGSQGQLFSITDSLSGSLMSVNDISGIPILEVFSDDRVVAGTFGSNALVVNGSSVGIGTASPSTRLEVASETEAITIRTSYPSNSSQRGALLWKDPANITGAIDTRYDGTTVDMHFGSLYNSGYNSTTRLVIKGNGDVGIGTTDFGLSSFSNWNNLRLGKTANLFFHTSTNTFGFNVGRNFYFASDASYKYLTSDEAETIIFSGGNIDFNNAASGTEDASLTWNTRMRITSGGNVGVGTTLPATKLHVKGTWVSNEGILAIDADSGTRFSGLTMQNNGTAYGYLYHDNTDSYVDLYATSGTGLRFYTADTTRMVINSSGNVGINTASPGYKLDVSGSVRLGGTEANNLPIRMGHDSSAIYMGGANTNTLNVAYDTNGAYTLHVNYNGYLGSTTQFRSFQVNNGKHGLIAHFEGSTGNVGIGSASPAYKLDVNGTGRFTGAVTMENDLTVTGIITAKEFHTTFVSASIIYQSGSTQFGNSSDDTHIFTGNIGINTTSPAGILDIRGSYPDNAVRIQNTNTSNYSAIGFVTSSGDLKAAIGVANSGGGAPYANNAYVYTTAGTDFVVATGASEKMRVTSGGSVGIGIDSPTQKFQVAGNIAVGSVANGYAEAGSRYIGTSYSSPGTDGYTGFQFESVNAPAPYNGNYSQNLKFYTHHYAAGTGGTPRMTIQYDGKVGINTTSPSAKLEIAGFSTGAGLKLNYGNSSGTIEAVNFIANGAANGVIGMQMVSAGVGDLWLGGSGGRSLTLYRDGNVGIGTDSPGYLLDVKDGNIRVTGSVNEQLILDFAASVGNYTYQSFRLNGANKYRFLGYASGDFALYSDVSSTYPLYINANGNVGIGTASPNTKLHVYSSGTTYAKIEAGGGDYAYVHLATPSSGDGYLIKNIATANSVLDKSLYLWNGTGPIQFVPSGTVANAVTIDTSGNLGVGTSVPAAKLHVVGDAIFQGLGFNNHSNQYNTSTPGIASFGASALDSSISYYDTGVNFLNNNARGIVWTGKHYIIADHISYHATFYDNNFTQISNVSGSTTVTLPMPSGYDYPHGSAWDGRYLYVVVYGGGQSKIVGYDVHNGTTTATIVAESAAITAYSAAYDIEYAEGHLYTVANGIVYIYKLEGKTITQVRSTGNILSSITAQAITYDGSYLWATQNSANVYKLKLDGSVVSTFTTGYPPDNIGWAWNGENIVALDYTGGDISVLNTSFKRIDTETLALMGGNVGIGITSPGYKLQVAGDARIDNTLYINNSNGTAIVNAYSGGSIGTYLAKASSATANFTTTGVSYPRGLGFGAIIGQGNTTDIPVKNSSWNGGYGGLIGFWSDLDYGVEGGTNSVGYNAVIKGTGASNSYGFFADLSGATDGTRYGIYTKGEQYNYFSGSVGIGTTSPSAKLDIKSATNSNAIFVREDTDNSITHNFWIDSSDNGNFWMYANGQSHTVAINSAGASWFNGGNVGVGTTAPNRKFVVTGAANDEWIATFTNSGTNPYGVYVDTSANSSTVYSFAVYTNAGTGLFVRNDGRVGVGTTAPGTSLHVSGGWVRSEGNSTDTYYYEGAKTGTGVTLRLYDNADNIYIDGWKSVSIRANQIGGTGGGVGLYGGEVTMGTINAAGSDTDKFLVSDSGVVKYRTGAQVLSDIGAQASGNYVTDAGGAAGQVGVWSSATAMSGSNALYWNGANLGIGTPAPANKLHVEGSVLINSGTGGTFNDLNIGGINGWGSGEAHRINFVYNTAASPDIFQTIESYYNGSNTGRMRFRNFFTNGPQTGILMTIHSNGNVGIGADDPSEHLSIEGAGDQALSIYSSTTGVQGTARTFIKLFGQNTASTKQEQVRIASAPGGTQSTAGQLIISTNNASGNLTERLRIDESGYVGIGTTGPTYPLHVQAGTNLLRLQSTDTDARMTIAHSANGGYIGYTNIGATSNVFYVTTGAGTVGSGFVMDNNGNVGIGTTNPAAKLDVYQSGSTALNVAGSQGQLFSVTDSLSGSLMSVNDISGIPILEVFSDDRVVAGTFGSNALVVNGSSVGVGTTNPGAKLEVAGNGTGKILIGDIGGYANYAGISLNGSTAAGYYNILSRASDGTLLLNRPFGDIAFWENNAALHMIIKGTSGNVGIGSASPAYKLDVTGTIRATGDVIAYSDRRVKQDIVTLENSVELIQKLRGVSYKKIGESEEKIGVIAQEILEVLPQVVSEDENGMYSVAYGNMAGLFIEAIKQQQAHIDTLEQRIEKLEQLLTQKP